MVLLGGFGGEGSAGESSDLAEVVGEDAVSAPDSGPADPDEFGAVPAVAACDVVDPALAAGAPLDPLAERSAVFSTTKQSQHPV